MQAVLQKDVPKLGRRGDIVNVKNGYFRNFLYPRGMAVFADKGMIKIAESFKAKQSMKKQQIVEQAEDVISKLKGLKLVISSKASAQGTLYAGITEDDVITLINEKTGVELEKSMLKMDHFKDLGDHEVNIHLASGFDTVVNVEVVSE